MTNTPEERTVLVTGASGFIAMHCILQLLQQGYRVRGTLRTPSRADNLHATFAQHAETGDRLEFVEADLMRDEGWDIAVEGCTYVLHVASPLPRKNPEREDELIIPAREGTLRVLQAASAAGVKRVVQTSSIAAMIHSADRDDSKVYDENDWSTFEGKGNAYPKSKTYAEQAAWEYIRSLPEGDQMELATINPSVVLGPILDEDYGTSGEVVRKLMRKEYPGCPNLGFSFVDVRDVAAAHLAAMTVPEAAGERFACSTQFAWVQEVAIILHDNFAARGYKIPTRKMPNLFVHAAALFDPTIRLAAGNLGKRTNISNEHIRKVLNWQPRSLEEMVVSMGESLIKYGVV